MAKVLKVFKDFKVLRAGRVVFAEAQRRDKNRTAGGERGGFAEAQRGNKNRTAGGERGGGAEAPRKDK